MLESGATFLHQVQYVVFAVFPVFLEKLKVTRAQRVTMEHDIRRESE
jgi:hypothetical protein